MSEDRASDYPQPSIIRKSPHIRGVRQVFPPEPPPPPTEAMANIIGHGARTYDPLAARQMMVGHYVHPPYSMTYARQRMIGHGARPDYVRGSATQIMIGHSAVV